MKNIFLIFAILAITIITTGCSVIPYIPLDLVERKVLGSVDVEALRQEDIERSKAAEQPGPMRYAITEEVSFNLENSGTWQLAEGGQMWRLRIHSPGAVSHSLGITSFDLPEGATLKIYDLKQLQVQGSYTSANRSNKGRLWTAMVESDEVVVELFVPSGSAGAVLEITEVIQGYRSFGEGGSEKSGTCNNDVICPVGGPWSDQIRSVARYTIGGFVCTGQLVNNTSVDFTPYFLSAEHCGVTAANDDTLVFYWNFESPNCGDLGGGSLADNQTGSIFRSSNAASDFLLVELSAMPSAASNVFYTGWDRTGNAPASTVAIHHPSGDEKAISFNNNAVASTNYLSSAANAAANHWRVDDWEDGTTEGGSSGSCLWDAASKLCVGQLHGGNASCTSVTDDWYGKFSVSWAGGGTNATRLSNWLDPGNTGVSTLNGDPHITTLDGTRYDFQGAGEFVALRDANGSEVQVRQAPIATTFTPGANAYHGLATCVSLNTAVAAQVGEYRISYQPNLSGEPDPSGLQLRINSDLINTLELPIDLGNGGGISKTSTQGGIEIDFPEKYTLIVTPGWWESQSKWYLNISVLQKSVGSTAGASLSDGSLRTGGLNAPITKGNWLSTLPDGTQMGPMPASLHDRYVGLYEKFGAAWRVSDASSLFDYASGTSTADFTLESWPGEDRNCELPDVEPVDPLDLEVAQQLCEEIPDRHAREECVFDVRVTGERGFANTYLQSLRDIYGENCEPGRAGILPPWCEEKD